MGPLEMALMVEVFQIFADGNLRSAEVFGEFPHHHASFRPQHPHDFTSAFFTQHRNALTAFRLTYSAIRTAISFLKRAMSSPRARPGPSARQLAEPQAAASRTDSAAVSPSWAANAKPASVASPLPTQERAANSGPVANNACLVAERQIKPAAPNVIAPAAAPASNIALRTLSAECIPSIFLPIQTSA